MALFVGVDVGGTKVLAAAVSGSGDVLRTARRSTPGRRVEAALVEDALTEAVHEVAAGEPVAGVGIAAAGFVDAEGERVRFAPHLPWRGEGVRSRLSERWGTVVALDNDANCAARAECRYGAARGVSDALVLTLGTGIGGAVVLDGQVHRGRNGMAGEFGHMQVVPDGQPCECGGDGCWEQYCSGNALIRYARERIGREPSVLEELCEGDPLRLTGPMVTAAAEDGDLVAAFDPECVVVGGGVSAAGDRLLEPARTALTRSLVGAGHRVVPPLVRAQLGPQAGVVGAADLARERAGAAQAGGARGQARR